MERKREIFEQVGFVTLFVTFGRRPVPRMVLKEVR
jgi:hypothetical protein